MADVTERDPAHPIDTPAPPLPHARGPAPSLWLLFRVWLALGAQSFGGGAATLFLIRRAVVEQRGWLTAEEFTRDWSICFVAPGINLLCMTILVGRRVAGLVGSVVALVGLLLPSVTITIAMTALYSGLQRAPMVQAALRGIVPGTVGLGLLLGADMARPLVVASRRERRGSLLVSVLLLAGSATAAALWQPPVIVMLCGAGAISALAMWWREAQGGERP
jgi:chromate transporter